MRVVLPRSGPGVAAPPFLRAVLLVDLLVALGIVGLGVGAGMTGAFPRHAWVPLALVGYGVALLVVDLAVARMAPKGLTWRRRLGYLAMGAAVWRGGPIEDARVAVAIILYMGVVWVALVTGGRALSRAIALSTGEDKPE